MVAVLVLIIFISWTILVTHLGVWNEYLSKKQYIKIANC